MNKKLYLSFLWHMHQPYYKDDITNTTMMPWVFLHGTKDYYDIPWYLEKYPNQKATFNLVPSLLLQLQSYIDNSANDKLLNILSKEIAELTQDEILFLEEYLFLPNENHMIRPLPRYQELLLKFRDEDNSIKNFSNGEIIELQVLFLLSWCGNYLRQNSSFIKELLQKNRSYCQNDKIQLINEMKNFIKEIIPYYKSLEKKAQIDISTTPFYHPILPLLLDRNSAIEARNDVVLPSSNANYSDFASLQVENAIEYCKKIFDNKIKGFWPSEGSVSLKTINLLAKNDVKWACTDEEILFKSLGKYQKELLYKPYFLNIEDKKIFLYFRDKYLSDLIGFDYSRKEAKEAANDFVLHLKNIYLNAKESVLVPVILDGENAWEFYPNNAMDFFDELYKLLDEQTWCQSILFDEVSQYEDLKPYELKTLTSGSWINGNFDIWIGSCEKNIAWELLDLTKNTFDSKKESLCKETIEKINKEFLIALGSDWFWWYGDDHYTELNHHFDEQFRYHLKNIYELMNIKVPTKIYTPIVQKQKTHQINIPPTDFINPLVDGNISNYFEWLNSGFIDIKKEFSTMDSSTFIIESLYYGVDKQNSFYLYFQGDKLSKIDKNLNLKIILNDNLFIFDIKKGKFSLNQNENFFDVAFDVGFELKLHDFKQTKVKFSFEIFEEEKLIQNYPIYDESILDFENLLLKSWYI